MPQKWVRDSDWTKFIDACKKRDESLKNDPKTLWAPVNKNLVKQADFIKVNAKSAMSRKQIDEIISDFEEGVKELKASPSAGPYVSAAEAALKLVKGLVK
jgi:hypothetical protein